MEVLIILFLKLIIRLVEVYIFTLNFWLTSLLLCSSQVMDNFLIQVTGKKQVVLYSPRDAPYLYLSGMHVIDI